MNFKQNEFDQMKIKLELFSEKYMIEESDCEKLTGSQITPIHIIKTPDNEFLNPISVVYSKRDFSLYDSHTELGFFTPKSNNLNGTYLHFCVSFFCPERLKK